MAQEFSAGLVVFRRKPNFFQYLLLQTSKGKNHWTPPKGCKFRQFYRISFIQILKKNVNSNLRSFG